jgi:hypothetical protein
MQTKRFSNRLLSALLALVMVLGMLPVPTLAAEEAAPIPISTQDDLINIKNNLSGSYKLTGDITLTGKWTPIGSSAAPFTGILDGDGYTISGLDINDGSIPYLGLFSVIGDGGTVQNMTVDGTVIGAKNYIGAIAGTNKGTIKNCINKVNVSGSTTGQYVGGIVGSVEGTSTQSAKVTGCVNVGNIEGKNYVGGIAGQGKYADITYCYNVGTISDTIKGARFAGLVGFSTSGGKLSRSYNLGQINIKYGSTAATLVGWLNGMSMDRCYWLSDVTGELSSHMGAGSSQDCSVKTEDEIKEASFLNLLNEGAPEGSRFVSDPGNLNNGYPVLECQLPKVEKFEVRFDLTPVDAALAVRDAKGATQTGAKGIYRLPAGEYTYRASAFGYADKSGAFTVKGAGDPGTVTVALQEITRQKVTFSGLPQGAVLTVSQAAAGQLASESDGSYRLPAGEYSYTAVAKGCEPIVNQKLIVVAEPVNENISMLPLAAAQPWDGTAKTEVKPIDGTYYIKNGAELAWFAAQINAQSFLNAKAVLLADIDLDGKAWTSIGSYDRIFNGSFDGNGCTVSGLAGKCYGLFYGIAKDGIVKNLTVSGSIVGTSNTGGIVGVNNGAVKNCAASVTVSADGQRVGGIAGNNSGGLISGCAALAPVSSSYTTFGQTVNLGGIVGQNSGTIEFSYSAATVAATGQNHNGGVGGVTGVNTGSIKSCYNVGLVSFPTGDNKATGAIIGTLTIPGSVQNTFYLDSACAKGVGDGSSDGLQAKTDAEMKKYTLAVSLNNGSVEGPFHLAAGESQNSGYPVLKWQGGTAPVAPPEERAVAQDKSALTLSRQVYTQAGTIKLPKTGAAGSAITWESDKPGVVSAAGVVTLPTAENKVTVVLTATLAKGEAKDTKSFTLTVYSAAQVTLNYLEEAKFSLRRVLTPVYGRDSNIVTLVEEQLADSGFGDVTVVLASPGSVTVGNETYIATDGAITYYYRDPGTTSGLNEAIVRDISFTLSKDGQSVTDDSLRANIPWDRARVISALQAQVASKLTWEVIKKNNSSPKEITTNLTLPLKLETAGWAKISWESDSWTIAPQEASPTATETSGAVTRQSVDTQANLTASIRFNLTTTNEPDIILPVPFDLTVLGSAGADTPEKMQQKLESYTLEKLKDSVSKVVIDPSAVTGDLQFPMPANTGVADFSAYRFTVTSKNTDVMTVSGYRGYIYRPLPGSAPAKVGFTVTMTSRANPALSASKEMEITVQPLKKEEIDEALRLMEAVRKDYTKAILGANTDKDAITSDLKTFREAVFGNDGQSLVYSRNIIEDTGRGIVVDNLPGSEPGGPGYEQWRTFRSSRPDILIHEVLRLAEPKPFYNTTVVVESCLTHSVLGKYALKHPENRDFKALYKVGIQTPFTVTGSSGETNPNPDRTFEVTFSLDGKGFIDNIPAISVSDLKSGANVFDVFARVLPSKGFTYDAKGAYIASVTDSKGRRLAEFDKGEDSGWMYTVNGVFPGKTMEGCYLSGGENIQFLYTGDWKQEPGVDGGMPEQPTSGTVLKPNVTRDKNGTDRVEMTESGLASAIKAAKDSKTNAIVIEPVIRGGSYGVMVELPKTSLSAIGSDTGAGLMIKTPAGSILFPNDVLSSVTAQASGSTVTIGTAAVEKKSLTEKQRAAAGDGLVYDISILSAAKKINSFGGKSITVSLPYTLNAGKKSEGVAVWYLSDAGKLARMACTYDKATALASFNTTHLSNYVVGYDTWTNPFTDVRPGDWFYDGVKHAVQKELFTGASAATFAPNTDMTRSMLVTVLHRLEGKPAFDVANTFADVVSGDWYTPAVLWSNKNGIVTGYGGGVFGINDAVTREQLTVILYRYAQMKGYSVAKSTQLTAYTDEAAVSTWAVPAMKWAVAEGLMTGPSEAALLPGSNTSRAQVAEILMRFMESFMQ